MKALEVGRDIVPIGKFKAHVSEVVRELKRTRRPLVITQNGRPRPWCWLQPTTIG